MQVDGPEIKFFSRFLMKDLWTDRCGPILSS